MFDDYVCEGYEYVGYGFRTSVGSVVSDTVLYRTVQTLDGCDSIVQLNLDFVPTVEIDTVVFIEDGDYYDFGEKSLTKPGEYTETFITSLGCDSIVHLTLEVGTSLDVVCSLPLVIAPNPVSGSQMAYVERQFTIEEQSGLRVEVVNSVGKVIYSDVPTIYPIAIGNIDVSGIYYVRITTGTGQVYVGRLMVK